MCGSLCGGRLFMQRPVWMLFLRRSIWTRDDPGKYGHYTKLSVSRDLIINKCAYETSFWSLCSPSSLCAACGWTSSHRWRTGSSSRSIPAPSRSLINKQNYYYGLRLNMNRTIQNIGGIRWDDPNNNWDSVVFLSRVDLRETFHYPDDKETLKIYPLPKDLSPLYILFDRVYFKEKSNEVLLIP